MNDKSRIVLRLVAGLYLVYTGIKLIQGLMADKPANMVLMSVIAVAFIIVGAIFSILSIKEMKGLSHTEPAGEQSEEEENQEPEKIEDGLHIAGQQKEEVDSQTTDEEEQ